MRDHGNPSINPFEYLGFIGMASADLLSCYENGNFDNYTSIDKKRKSFPIYDELRTAYKDKSRETHPDRSSGSKEMAQAVNQAWSLINCQDDEDLDMFFNIDS